MAPPHDARMARLAVSMLFFANGALISTVVPRLPAIKASLVLSNAELGTAVAAMPIGGLVAGGLAGALAHRFGSGRLAGVTGILSGVFLVSLALAPGWLALVLAFAVLGALDATMDAAQNAHGFGVQRVYGRSILQAFHGWWSVGTIAGGTLGAVAAGIGLPVPVHLLLAGAVIAAVAFASMRWLLPDSRADARPAGEPADDPVRPRAIARLLRVLGPVALLGLLGLMLEDAATTWSTVYLVETLGLGAGVAATAYVLYAASMTLGRLTNDRWVDRWGDVTVVRTGAAVAAAGLVLVAVAGFVGAAPLAWPGFAAVGAGTSSMFGIMVSAAGARPGIPAAHAIAIVSWLARIGVVLAPAAIGFAADGFGLAAAFAIPLAAALLIAAFVPAMIRPRSAPA